MGRGGVGADAVAVGTRRAPADSERKLERAWRVDSPGRGSARGYNPVHDDLSDASSWDPSPLRGAGFGGSLSVSPSDAGTGTHSLLLRRLSEARATIEQQAEERAAILTLVQMLRVTLHWRTAASAEAHAAFLARSLAAQRERRGAARALERWRARAAEEARATRLADLAARVAARRAARALLRAAWDELGRAVELFRQVSARAARAGLRRVLRAWRDESGGRRARRRAAARVAAAARRALLRGAAGAWAWRRLRQRRQIDGAAALEESRARHTARGAVGAWRARAAERRRLQRLAARAVSAWDRARAAAAARVLDAWARAAAATRARTRTARAVHARAAAAALARALRALAGAREARRGRQGRRALAAAALALASRSARRAAARRVLACWAEVAEDRVGLARAANQVGWRRTAGRALREWLRRRAAGALHARALVHLQRFLHRQTRALFRRALLGWAFAAARRGAGLRRSAAAHAERRAALCLKVPRPRLRGSEAGVCSLPACQAKARWLQRRRER